jgi:hypothetical protein
MKYLPRKISGGKCFHPAMAGILHLTPQPETIWQDPQHT